MSTNASLSGTDKAQSVPWTREITPDRGLLDVPLQEIWEYRDLWLLLVRRDFVAKFKQSLLGPAWWFVQPILTTLVFTMIFGRLAKLSTDGLPQLPFYLAGVTCWGYFSSCFSTSANTLLVNATLFGKVYFPRLVAPLAELSLQLLKFSIQILLLAAAVAYYAWRGQMQPRWEGLLLAPVLLVLMASLGLGMGLILASLTAKYRDLNNLVDFGVRLLMFATPVIYPASLAKGKLATCLWWNPLTPIFESLRYGFLGAGQLSVSALIYSGVFSIVTLVAGVILFNQLEKTFIDSV